MISPDAGALREHHAQRDETPTGDKGLTGWETATGTWYCGSWLPPGFHVSSIGG